MTSYYKKLIKEEAINKTFCKIHSNYKIVFENENDIIKKIRSLKKYCIKAYKELIFYVFNNIQIQDGYYEKELTTYQEFKKVHGQIKVIYEVRDKKITIKDITPSKFLIDGYMKELETYKGMYYNDEKDKFKINLVMKLKEQV